MGIINNYVLLLLCIFLVSCNSLESKRQKTHNQDIVPNLCKKEVVTKYNRYGLPLITACVDQKIVRTLWTKHTVRNSTVANYEEHPEQNYCRNRFTNTHFRGVNMDYLYYYEQWNKGHLAPYGDFQKCEAALSCDYVNLAPQYPGLNKGAWNQLERSVRKVKNATVFTGTLFNNGLDHTVKYLGKNLNNSQNILPVPHFFYKLVIKDKKAVAFVGINDFVTLCNKYETRRIKRFCQEDLCPNFSLSWAPIKPIYCCSASEFLENVDENERPITPISVRSFDFLNNTVNDTVHHAVDSRVSKTLNFCNQSLKPGGWKHSSPSRSTKM